MSNGEHIEVETKLGKLAIWGRDIIIFLLLLAIGGLIYLELKEIRCLVGLTMWEISVERRAFNLRQVPAEYYKCVPRFLFNEP